MKTLTQYREDIKNLMQKSGDIDAKCVNEGREITESELALKNELLDEVESIRKITNAMERQERIQKALAEPADRMTVQDKSRIEIVDTREKDKFSCLGEQLAAVMNAGRPGGKVDQRLFNAASGLSETVPSDGGFLVQQDFTNEMLQEVFQTGVLASRCRRIPISGNSNSIKINGVDETSRASTRYGGIVGYWVDEAAEKTASKPKFRKIELSLKKLIGLCYATDELLADAAALEAFIRNAFVGEFNFLLDDAIINGTGAGMPLGIINSGCLVSVGKESGQTAATVVTENIVKMWSRRFASQSQNYAWFYNQNIEPQLHTMSLSVGTGGGPVYMPPGGLSQSPYGTLYGRPAIAIEQAATLGTQGDIILANFRDGYILAEKGGIQSDMSIHVRFIYDESVFRFVMRIDGQPVRASALTPYKGGATATQSHFIVLDTRS
jgi:HK97 family phage major capsid protein